MFKKAAAIIGLLFSLFVVIFATMKFIFLIDLARIITISTVITIWEIGLCIYAIPSIVAIVRKHSNLTPVILVNVLLGWSIVGWIVALIWSFTDNVNNQKITS